jgi:hypothetical protein
MKLPRNSKKVLHFNHGKIWYRIVQDKDKYILYRCGETESDYEMLGTGNTPPKLEERVYSGKVK